MFRCAFLPASRPSSPPSAQPSDLPLARSTSHPSSRTAALSSDRPPSHSTWRSPERPPFLPPFLPSFRSGYAARRPDCPGRGARCSAFGLRLLATSAEGQAPHRFLFCDLRRDCGKPLGVFKKRMRRRARHPAVAGQSEAAAKGPCAEAGIPLSHARRGGVRLQRGRRAAGPGGGGAQAPAAGGHGDREDSCRSP
jgi:hypothetical protein